MRNYFQRSNLFIISLGAIPGTILRWQSQDFFIVNLIGCFILGLINSLPLLKKIKLLFGVGFCASLTTFSGWIFYLYQLINEGLYKMLFINIISIVFLGLFAVACGNLVGKKIINLVQ
tara:strand:- start:169 stop:522 length:354 start_codon:yes stop_codon:yes gene_type:complete